MNSPPPVLVSAIVSTFNAARFLRGCIEDLEGQTISDAIEIIVVDSASEENEGEIVREYQERYPNIRYIRTEQRESVYAAWNRGIHMACGKYITNANTDDRHLKSAFARMTHVLEMRPEVALVYADVFKTETGNETFERCTENGRYCWYDWDRNLLLTQGCFMGPQPMWRRSVHDLYGYFDESLVTSGDYEFWLRISQTSDFHHIREPLGLYLVSPDSIEHRNRGLKNAEDVRILSLYRGAASNGEIVRCLPLEELKQIAWNNSCKPSDRLQAILGQLESLAGLNHRLTGGKAGNLSSDASRFFDLKRQLLQGHTPADVVAEFIGLGSALSLNRTNWFPRYQKNPDARNRFLSRYPVKTADRPNTGDKDMLPVEQVYEAMQPVLQASRPGNAVRALQNIVRSFPDFARAHSDLGTLYYQSGEKQKAIAHYERAATISPENADFQKHLADYYYVEMARAEDALKLYSKVLQARPTDVETLLTAGHILVSLQRFEEADAYYRKVLEIEPWNPAANENHTKLSQMGRGGNGSRKAEDVYAEVKRLLALGDQAGARRQLERMLEVCPHFALAHNDLAVLCYQSGDKDQALRHYEEAVKLQPENPTFQKNLADFYYVEQGRIEDALRIYVRILEMQPEDIETLMALARVCNSLSRREDARTFYERVLEIEPWNADAQKAMQEFQRGSQSISPAAAPAAPAPQDLYDEAARLISAGDTASGRDRLLQLVTLYPEFALAHNDIGVLAYQVGEKHEALERYQKAALLEPSNMTFQKNLADCYWIGFGRLEDALKIYVDIMTAHPEDIETLLATGKICLSLRQVKDARVFFDRVLEIEPWNAEAHQQLEQLETAAAKAA
jgi:tetratricopeptide (TPR) repeat protein